MYQLLRDTLPWLFAFYVLDGLVRVEAGQLVLARVWRTYRARRGGVQLVAPWPTSEAMRTYDPPVIVTTQGFHVVRASAAFPIPRAEDMSFHAFESGARATRDGRSVVYGKRVVLKAPSEGAAASVVRLLAAAGEAAPDRRLEACERWLKATGDPNKLRTHAEGWRTGARARRFVAALLFAAMFVVVPALLLHDPETVGAGLELAVLAILALHVIAVVLTRRGLRRADHLAPRSALASILLFPPNAAHAPLVITRDLFAGFHPMAVAAELLPADDFYELARRERHRLDVVLAAAGGGDTADYWRLRLESLDRIAAAAKADVKRLATAPPRTDEQAAAYCPLCFTEYRPGFDACADCGTALRAFSTP